MLLPTGELSNCSPLWGGDWQHPGIVWLPRTSLAKGIQTDQCAYKSLFIAFICFRESMFFTERHIWKKFCHPYLTFHFALFRQYIVSQPSRYCRDKHWMKPFPSHLLNLWDSFPCKENILKLTFSKIFLLCLSELRCFSEQSLRGNIWEDEIYVEINANYSSRSHILCLHIYKTSLHTTLQHVRQTLPHRESTQN